MIDLNDFLVLLGLALMLVGAWLVSPPLAIAVAGALLVLVGGYRARKR